MTDQGTLLPTSLAVRCEADALAKALKLVTPFTTSGPPHPIAYSGVLLTADAGELTMQATNGDQMVVTSLPVGVESEGQVVVPAKMLDGFVRTLSGAVEIASRDEHQVNISAGASSFDLRTIVVEQWPHFEEIDAEPIDLGEHWQGIGRTLWAEAPVDDKASTGHCVRFDTDAVAVVCGKSLSSYGIPGLKASASVPISFMNTLQRAVVADAITAQFGERTVAFESGRTRWMTRTTTDAYPEWRKLLRDTSPCEITVATADLLKAISRSALLPEESGFRRIELRQLGDELVLTTTGADIGTITDVIPCTGTYDGQMISLKISLLKDFVTNAEDTEITFELMDAYHHVRTTKGEWIGVIMPLKPDNAPAAAPAYPTSSKANPNP